MDLEAVNVVPFCKLLPLTENLASPVSDNWLRSDEDCFNVSLKFISSIFLRVSTPSLSVSRLSVITRLPFTLAIE